jgi:hypothetical protein
MIFKMLKLTVLASAGALVVGGLVFGSDLVSYMRTGARSVQTSVKESIPTAFELQRAKDMLDDILPEMHANVKLIAQQEVECANLKDDIARSQQALGDERVRVSKLRDAVSSRQVSFTFGDVTYSRTRLTEELSHRFDLLKESEMVLAGKQRLLENRTKALDAAMQALERTRSQKAMLETQIAGLEAQYRLVEAAAVGSGTPIDTTKLASTQKLIAEIKNKLDVAERVLVHEAKFVQPVNIEAVDEKELLRQVDEHLEDVKPNGLVAVAHDAAAGTTSPQPEKLTQAAVTAQP